MVQTVFPFLHSPLNAPDFLDHFRFTARTGVAVGSLVRPGGSGWYVSIGAGSVIIDGSLIEDDLDKIDAINLAHAPGTDRHYVVYEIYSYASSDPPAAAQYAVASAAPGVQPVLPAGAVKLADIFIPTTAASIGLTVDPPTDLVKVTTTAVRIVNTPRLWPKDDTGDLLENLVIAASNSQLIPVGTMTYNDGTGNITVSAGGIIIQSLSSSNRNAFNNAPVVRATLAAGTYPVPGVSPTRDVLVYALIDRSTPGTAAVVSLKFLNRLSPAAAELKELLDPANRTRIVILGTVYGVRFVGAQVLGALPAPASDTRMYLNNDPAGAHTWQLIDDGDLVGGARSVASIAARDLIATDLRKEGMIVYSLADDRHFVLEGGLTNSDWKELGDDSRLIGGFRTLSWTTVPGDGTNAALVAFINAQIPAAKRKQGMRVIVHDTVSGQYMERVYIGSTWTTYEPPISTFGATGCFITNPSANTIEISVGEFYNLRGKKIFVPQPVQISTTSANRFIFWDDSAKIFNHGAIGSCDDDDVPFAFVNYSGGFLVEFIDLRPQMPNGPGVSVNEICIGGGANNHFSYPYEAAMWMSAFSTTSMQALVSRTLRCREDTSWGPNVSTVGVGLQANISAGGLVTGDPAHRFKRDLAAGDSIQINSAQYLVAAANPTSDTSMSITQADGSPYSGGAQLSQTVFKNNWACSSSPSIDLTLTNKFGANSLSGLTISGPETLAPDTGGFTEVNWGSSSYTPKVAPLNLGGLTGVTLRNLKCNVSGLRNTTVADHCFIKNPGFGLSLENVHLAGGGASQSVTSVFSLGSVIGGKASEPCLAISRCSFTNVNGVGTSIIHIGSASASGKFVCRDSQVDVTVAGDCEFIISNRSSFSHSIDFTFVNCDISNITTMTYDERTIAQSNKLFSNCSFGNKNSTAPMRAMVRTDITGLYIANGVAPTFSVLAAPNVGVVTVSNLSGFTPSYEGALLIIAGQANGGNNGIFIISRYVSATSVQIYNPSAVAESGAGTWTARDPVNDDVHLEFDDCVYGDDIDFIGAGKADGRFIAAVTYNLRTATAINSDFSIATSVGAGDYSGGSTDFRGKIRVSEEDLKTINKVSVTDLELLSSMHFGGVLGYVSKPYMEAFRLSPSVEYIDGSGFRPHVNVTGGAGRFPSGKFGFTLLQSSFNLVAGGSTDITGAAFVANKFYYFFARYTEGYTNIASHRVDLCVASTFPPQASGALGTGETPQGGHVREDYLYIGCLPTVTVTVQAASTDVWGKCSVVYDTHTAGTYRRRVYLPNVSSFLDNEESVTHSNKAPFASVVTPGLYNNTLIAPTPAVNAADISAFAGNVATVTGLTGMVAGDVGKLLRLSGAVNDGNQGVFRIIHFVDATSVKILNPWAVVENPGAIDAFKHADIGTTYPTACAFGLSTEVKIIGADSRASVYIHADTLADRYRLDLAEDDDSANANNNDVSMVVPTRTVNRRASSTYRLRQVQINSGANVDVEIIQHLDYFEEDILATSQPNFREDKGDL